MTRFLLATAVCLALSACALPSSNTVANKWKGHNIAEAVTELGPPRRIVEMPGARSMYVWESIYSDGEYLCSTGITVDPTGTITGASQRTNSLLCR